MKKLCALIISVAIFYTTAYAQKRVVDAEDKTPIVAASVFDKAGNLLELTDNNGVFTDIPASAYPLTVSCLGYDQLVIERPENKTWDMKPMYYDLPEVVIDPSKRNVVKQTFYIREYFSMTNNADTVTLFTEHMAERFIPTTKEAKFGGNYSLRIISTRQYGRIKIQGRDSIISNPKKSVPSLLSLFDLDNDDVKAPESFTKQSGSSNIYEKSGKSGMSLIQKQNAQTFTVIEDMLADKKNHKMSPWALKAIGFTMDFNEYYTTYAYRANKKGVYKPSDLKQASFVMEADGKGKHIRKIFKTDNPVDIRSCIDLFVVDTEYLTKEDAKDDYKNKPSYIKFEIPSTVPPLNNATKQLVKRAKAESPK